MKKIKLFLSIILISLLIFKILNSISFAANGGVFIETTYNGNGKAIIDAIIDDYFNGGDTNNSSYLDIESAIYQAIEQPFTSISLRFSKGTGSYWTNYLNVGISNTSFNFTNGGNYLSQVAPYTNYQLSNYRNSLSGSITNQTSNYGVSLSNLGSTNDLVAVYSSSYSNKWYQNSISGIHIGDYVERPDITFSPSVLATLVTYNSNDLYLYRINRSVTSWRLGSLSSNFKDVDQLTVRLCPLQWGSGDNAIYDGTYASSVYYKNGTFLNNNKLVLGSNAGISIPNYYVYYNNLYKLSIYYSYKGLEYDFEIPMYFKDVGSDTSINSLINPDANTGLDIEFIQSLDSYLNGNLDNSSGDINNFYNNVWGNMSFSGDFFSGDLLSQIGFIDYTNNEYDLFIYRIFKKVTDAIYNDSEDITLSFNYRGNVYNISSSDLTVPSSPLKTFITTFLIAGFIYLIIYRFHVWFIMITTVDLFSFLHSFNTDESMFL